MYFASPNPSVHQKQMYIQETSHTLINPESPLQSEKNSTPNGVGDFWRSSRDSVHFCFAEIMVLPPSSLAANNSPPGYCICLFESHHTIKKRSTPMGWIYFVLNQHYRCIEINCCKQLCTAHYIQSSPSFARCTPEKRPFTEVPVLLRKHESSPG